MKDIWPLPDVAATQALGKALAADLPWDARDARVLFLSGELGAGKTTLTAALLCALGVTEVVRSPSYALIELYQTRQGQAVHVDLYRLQSATDLEQLGLRDYLHGQCLLVIEWPERAPGSLPRADLHLELQTIPTRLARLRSHTQVGSDWWNCTNPPA